MVLKMVIDMLLNGCKGIAANVRPLADVRDLNTALVNVVMSPAYWQAVVGRSF